EEQPAPVMPLPASEPVAPAEPPYAIVREDPGTPDDLTQIRGISSATAYALSGLGITRFSHVAGFTARDVAQLTKDLGYRCTIHPDNWIEQAAILAAGGSTRFSRRGAPMFAVEVPISTVEVENDPPAGPETPVTEEPAAAPAPELPQASAELPEASAELPQASAELPEASAIPSESPPSESPEVPSADVAAVDAALASSLAAITASAAVPSGRAVPSESVDNNTVEDEPVLQDVDQPIVDLPPFDEHDHEEVSASGESLALSVSQDSPPAAPADPEPEPSFIAPIELDDLEEADAGDEADAPIDMADMDALDLDDSPEEPEAPEEQEENDPASGIIATSEILDDDDVFATLPEPVAVVSPAAPESEALAADPAVSGLLVPEKTPEPDIEDEPLIAGQDDMSGLDDEPRAAPSLDVVAPVVSIPEFLRKPIEPPVPANDPANDVTTAPRSEQTRPSVLDRLRTSVAKPAEPDSPAVAETGSATDTETPLEVASGEPVFEPIIDHSPDEDAVEIRITDRDDEMLPAENDNGPMDRAGNEASNEASEVSNGLFNGAANDPEEDGTETRAAINPLSEPFSPGKTAVGEAEIVIVRDGEPEIPDPVIPPIEPRDGFVDRLTRAFRRKS
ncbi:MAG: hypothetical protein ACR2O4_01900, partial [Hyphomicrobiaceae bacterium]